jgi:hypothetical protein
VPGRITEDLADRQDSHVSARAPRAEYLTGERAGGPRPLCPPASVTLSRTATLAITAPALPRPPRPGKPAGQRTDAGKRTLSSAANVKPTQTASADLVRGLSVPASPVRGRLCKADGPRTTPRPRFPSALRPWTAQYDGPQRDKVTHDGTEKTAR